MKINYKSLRKIPLDDPARTQQHANVIATKIPLRNIYQRWYEELIFDSNSNDSEQILEIGSGGGIIKQFFPNVITSEIIVDQNCDITCSAYDLPFSDGTLKAIIMIDVFHHLAHCEEFLKEASRVLKDDGKIVMIEPSNCFWSRLIYKNFHHEPFDETQSAWHFETKGPLSDSNMALPYIVFERDAKLFFEKYPEFKIEKIRYHTPVSYLLSGGLSRPNLVPASWFGCIRKIEKQLEGKNFSMFNTITITKKS